MFKSAAVVKIENWHLICAENGAELHITNTFANQKTVLKSDLNGFQFESNRNEKLSFTSDQQLNEEDFDIPWLKEFQQLKHDDDEDTSSPVTPIEGVKTQLSASAKLGKN